jgi:DNA-binding transcriptional LysR family regulator
MVSKQIKRLEEDLAVRLLNRSTRHCSLTESGAEYYDRCQHVLSYLEEADANVRNLSGEVRGTLKISAPATFGTLYLTPAIIDYKKRYPNLAFNLRIAPQMPDLLEGGFDLAIHAGGTRLDDSDLVARKLGSFQLVVCAAPSYLDEHGWPRHPNDLRRHNCLIFYNEMATDNWIFRSHETEITVRVEGDLHANQGAALRLAAAGGLGIVRLPDYLVHEEIVAGRLIEILSEYQSPPRAVHVMYPHRRLMPAKVRTFIDFLANRFETGHGFKDEKPVEMARA